MYKEEIKITLEMHWALSVKIPKMSVLITDTNCNTNVPSPIPIRVKSSDTSGIVLLLLDGAFCAPSWAFCYLTLCAGEGNLFPAPNPARSQHRLYQR